MKNHQTFSDNVSKANILNNQFSSLFTTDNDCSSVLEGHSYPDISAIQIDTQGVINLLHNLDPHKASGPDGIPARFLKETCNSIAPVLVLMYKASLKQGKLPRDWKRAYVVPIFKKGSRNDPSNYQPISLTCICCKLLERIISSAISAHANAGEHTDFILLDFSKAFDKVSHNSLLYKLTY